MWVIIRIYEGADIPVCSFPKDLLESIIALGATLDVDIY